MKLADKDVFVVIGVTRSGKGTLLTALQGRKMSCFKKKEARKSELNYEEIASNFFMAPVDEN